MKKTLAIIISALISLTLFTSCVADKADETLTPNPPTATNEASTEETTKDIETTTLQETENQTEAPTAAPQTTVPKVASAETKVSVTKKSVQKNESTKKAETTTVISTTKQELNISRDEAKEIALSHAGLSETDIRYYKSELDRERKTIVYEIEFDSEKYEYEYEINAETGKIVKAEKEIRD